MQKIVIEEPYRFVPPYRGRAWSSFFRYVLPQYLRLSHGIVEVNCRGLDRFRESVRQGKGVLLAPNHCRLSDPMTLGWLVRETGIHLYTMASWHLFKQDRLFDRLSASMMRRLGAFSILREGTDRAALTTAIDILASAERPLVIFPEGVVSRSNDRLGPLMDGVTFIARMAAKKAAKEGKPGVVIHPVALRYVFLDNVETAVEPFLGDLEQRLTWHAQSRRPLLNRLRAIGEALLSLKEIEATGTVGSDSLHDRRRRLIERLLRPIEEEWTSAAADDSVVSRVKEIRIAILPSLLDRQLSAVERERLRRQLDDAALAQQLHFHPEGYLGSQSPPERFLETVERLEEDLLGAIRVYGRFRVMFDVCEAIDVPSEREKRAGRGEPDPLLELIGERLRRQLEESGREVAASRGQAVVHDLVEQPEHAAAGT
ncbi:MAG: 1-acyl-sn-glycerol-3-phosphate acyltransferase [Planctomycetaceae bacterium]|nr:1-acyl-sn-glycerol-3-phosphate acyltransferase [Planctomycetaceae bacterium]